MMHSEVKQNHSPMCPVMNMPVDEGRAKTMGWIREYRRKTYYFCCGNCPKEFDKNPKKYAEGRHEAGHGAHDHGAMMSNPKMAEQMERDMKRRFLVSLLLSVPILLYSPLAI